MKPTSSGKNLTHAHVKGNQWLFRTEAAHLKAKIQDADETAEKHRKVMEWLEGHQVTRLPAHWAHFE